MSHPLKLNQTEAVLRLLRRRWITGLEALRELGCFRLAARVYDLERAGYTIKRRMVERNGKRYAAYRLA
jgi:hypothetical protein